MSPESDRGERVRTASFFESREWDLRPDMARCTVVSPSEKGGEKRIVGNTREDVVVADELSVAEAEWRRLHLLFHFP